LLSKLTVRNLEDFKIIAKDQDHHPMINKFKDVLLKF